MEIKRITKYSAEHYNLLLTADPDLQTVEGYLPKSIGFQLVDGDQVVGIVLLVPMNSKKIELKNIAVRPDYQHKGLAQKLIKNVLRYAKQHEFSEMIVGTGSASFEQLYLYQKMGFRCFAIRVDFFSDNYKKPIVENGLRLHDMILLRQKITND